MTEAIAAYEIQEACEDLVATRKCRRYDLYDSSDRSAKQSHSLRDGALNRPTADGEVPGVAMPRPFAIVSATDARYADFLANHLIPSVQANVNLDQIDIVVLDYSLTESQRRAIDALGVQRRECVRDGSVTQLRFRDIAGLLREVPYRQLLSVDAGDVIFQSDISHLFEDHPDQFRAVAEDYQNPYFYSHLLKRDDFLPEAWLEMYEFARVKPMLNSGFIIGPPECFHEFWRRYQLLSTSLQRWGVDQLVFNYVAHQHGFASLESKFNFVLQTSLHQWTVRKGLFYDADGELIPVVHNSGQNDFIRLVRKFGYGPDCNHPKRLQRMLTRFLVAIHRRRHRRIAMA